jgi:hypothetical protein
MRNGADNFTDKRKIIIVKIINIGKESKIIILQTLLGRLDKA